MKVTRRTKIVSVVLAVMLVFGSGFLITHFTLEVL